MKRVYLILTLFMTSFFLFSINEVKAETYDFIIDENNLDLINEDFFEVREYALNYVKENNGYYYIYYSKSSNCYRVFLMNQLKTSYVSFNQYILSVYLDTNKTGKGYNFINNEYVLWSTISSVNIEDYPSGNSIPMNVYLDSNFDIFNQNVDDVSNISYNGHIFTSDSTNPFPSLYQIYLDINNGEEDEPVIDDKFNEEKEIINNFYSTVATKIGELATVFASNYTFIVVLGIIILIFIFELIRRYLI